MSIVTMFEARDYLRIVGADLDPVIAIAIAAADGFPVFTLSDDGKTSTPQSAHWIFGWRLCTGAD